jgi:phosphohistidine phosphatase
VLCSTARRACETLERIEPALGVADVRFEPALYGASAGALLERLHDVPDRVGSVMLIGHNPGLQELALELAHSDSSCTSSPRSSRPRRWPRSSYLTGGPFAWARVT